MSTRRPFTLIAAVIFALMALAHVLRIAVDFQIVVGSHSLPKSVSYLALVMGFSR